MLGGLFVLFLFYLVLPLPLEHAEGFIAAQAALALGILAALALQHI